MHAVEVIRRGPHGTVRSLDRTGGVFRPSPRHGLTAPVYSLGWPDAPTKEPVFTCPVSAIPSACWDLLELWYTCRALGALPLAGGALDQPLSVRRAFPVFAAEHEAGQWRLQALGAAAPRARGRR